MNVPRPDLETIPAAYARGPASDGLWSMEEKALSLKIGIRNPELQNLENNAVFRILMHQHRRLTRKRKRMVFLYLLSATLFTTFYSIFLFHVEFSRALACGFAITVVLGLLLAVIYIQAGIEGYETNGFLKPFFIDIIMAGIPAVEIARGIWGKTVVNYPRKWLRAGLAVIVCVLFALILLLDRAHTPLLFLWMVYLGIWAATHLFGLLGFIEYVTLPGTLLWYRGVRRGYERRLREIEGAEPSFFAALMRMILFLSISFATVLIPLGIYLLVFALAFSGWNWPAEINARFVLHVFVLVNMIAAGAITSFLWCKWMQAASKNHFDRLTREIDRLFSIRGHVLSSR